MKMYHFAPENMTVQNNKSLVIRNSLQDNTDTKCRTISVFSLSTRKRTDCEYLQPNRAALYAAAAYVFERNA